MIYPRNIEEKLGFDKVRTLLKENCAGPVGEGFVDKMRFSNKFGIVKKLLSQVDEFIRLQAESEEGFPAQGFDDLTPYLASIRIPGSYLPEDECYLLKKSFETLSRCLRFLENASPERYPQLHKLGEKVEFDTSVLHLLDNLFDDKGRIKDNATPELAEIRQKIYREQGTVRKRVNQLIKVYKEKGFSKEDSLPTIREGRLVIPVAAEYKRQVKGFIHDASATGQTLYIEPEEILNLNNEIKDLILREKQEIIKILIRIANAIRPQIDSLEQANVWLGMMDFIRAKASFCKEIDATLPTLLKEPGMEWYVAFHPLLLLHHRELGKTVVHQDFLLNENQRILLISGPNAGGKSVAMKTVGLLQYMLQCGLLISVQEGSKACIFERIFMDYGDDQSLENDLSTYSSHLKNMRFFLRNANDKTLCLIDEFGSGTEPELGGAMAEAILEQFNRQQSFGVITTHYANLKFFAERTLGLVNGAMRYDVENLEPLYQLEIGKPGSSFAFEIASKTGLPKRVISQARKKAGKQKTDLETLLRDLEKEKREFSEKNRQINEQQKNLKVTTDKYKLLSEYLEREKKRILKEAKAEAKAIVAKANQQVENTIRQIKENKADKEATKQAREALDDFKEALTPDIEEEIPEIEEAETYEVIGGDISENDWVQIKGQETLGQVLELKGKDALVTIGQLKSNIKLNRLVKVSKRQIKKLKKEKETITVQHSVSSNYQKKMMDFKPGIDIRGKRAEEVLPILEDFMDSAIMFNHQNLRILHGKGDGVLRQMVRNHLRKYREVAQMNDEHADRGGDGITLVTLR